VIGALVRNETRKTFKRLATWITVGFFTFVLVMSFGEEFLDARREADETFALPSAWAEVLGEQSFVGIIFGGVLLILLISSEFSWRTARQNVIDGLAKDQWFTGKALLLPAVALLFMGEQVLIGGGIALAGTDVAATTEPLMGALQWKAIGGLLLAFMTIGSMGLAAAMATRSPGPAMAVWFSYIALGENLLRAGLSQLGDWIEPALRFLPFALARTLTIYQRWQLPMEGPVEEIASRAVVLDSGTLVLANLAWIAFFVVVSFLWFRRRDL
jgi:ABC-type transport system involved in multi-copper enzyme maturation permease subunit